MHLAFRALPFFTVLSLLGCGDAPSAPPESSVADAAPSFTIEEQDWDGDGYAEVRERFDADGRIVSAEWFEGTVDAFVRTYSYGADRRIEAVETETALGAVRRAEPVWFGGEIVAVRRERIDADGTELVEVAPLEEPCVAPWRCLDEC